MTSGNYLPPSAQTRGNVRGEGKGEETGVLVVVGWFRRVKHLRAKREDGIREAK